MGNTGNTVRECTGMKEVDYNKLAKQYGHDVRPELKPFRQHVTNKWRSDPLKTHPMNKECGAHAGTFSIIITSSCSTGHFKYFYCIIITKTIKRS